MHVYVYIGSYCTIITLQVNIASTACTSSVSAISLLQNQGMRMIEGAHINRSLLALANCINALTVSHPTHFINYRDSKLTRLLKDALGGNCMTIMIAHISPASTVFEESRNTLVYADRGKKIKNKVC